MRQRRPRVSKVSVLNGLMMGRITMTTPTDSGGRSSGTREECGHNGSGADSNWWCQIRGGGGGGGEGVLTVCIYITVSTSGPFLHRM